METVYILVGSLTAWTCIFLLTRESRRPTTNGRSVDWLRGRFQAALSAMARTPLVRGLDSIPSWHSVGMELAHSALGTGVPASATWGVAAIVLGDAMLCCVLSLVSWSPIGVAVGVSTAVAGVPSINATSERRRARELAAEMPGVFRTLATAVGSGETLSQAVEYVGEHERGEAGHAFSRASLRLQCGIPAEVALGELSRELSAPGVGLLTTALLISQRTGSPLKTLFHSAARLVERQGEFQRLLEVKTAQVRLSVRIVVGLPVAMIAALSLISPDFRAGLGTVPGIVSVALAVSMDVAALLIIRHLMRGVL